MELFITLIVVPLMGFFLWNCQEKVKYRTEINRKKQKLFNLIEDLELRRSRDLGYISHAFSTVVLVENGLKEKDKLLQISLPPKIEYKPIEETFNLVSEHFEVGYRDGVRSLLININAVNEHLDNLSKKFNEVETLTIDDLTGIHSQMIPYGYLVNQLNIRKNEYIYNGMNNEELLEHTARVFGIKYHIHDIVEEELKTRIKSK
ncbi:hypothetical protein ACP5PY_07275 [Photobacterium leiognathi subsp. mandapamensis]